MIKYREKQKNYCATEGDVKIDVNDITSQKLIDKIFNVNKPRKSHNFMKVTANN